MGLHGPRPRRPLSPLREQQDFLRLRQQTEPTNLLDCSPCCSAPLGPGWVGHAFIHPQSCRETRRALANVELQRILTLFLKNTFPIVLIWLLFIPVLSVRPCSRPFNPDASSSPPQLTYLPPPWGECEAKALGFFHVYSVTACRIDCETRYIVENCNCRMVHMPGRQRPWRMPAALRSPCSRRCFCCRRRVLLHT